MNSAAKTSAYAALAAMTASPSLAASFALNTQSAESLGAATAGAQATRATPGNAYFNPASIVGVEGLEGSLSVVGVLIDSSYNDASGQLLGTVPVSGAPAGEAPLSDGVFPTGAIAAPINDRFYVGLAVYSPFGFGSSYADDSVIRYHGTESELLSLSFTPLIGVALNDDWSIAAGPRIQYANVTLAGAIDAAGAAAAASLPGFIPGTDDVFFELEADRVDVGYIVGVQGRIAEGVSVGASYTSGIEHGFSGDATFDLDQSVAGQTLAAGGLFLDTGFGLDFATPATAQFGAVVDMTENARLLASGVLTRWSTFDQLIVEFDNPAQPTDVLTQNWDDAWTAALGAEIDLSPASTVRFGTMWEQTPVNEDFESTRIPDGDRFWIAGGFSTRLSARAELHVAASYVVAEDSPINQPATRPENLLRGAVQTEVEITSLLFGLGVDFRF